MEFGRDKTPWDLFDLWLKEAEQHEPCDPNAMSLATVDKKGMPHVRTVLLKQHSKKGFVFFTNFTSSKAQDMDVNPRISLLFYWKSLARQIRITGEVHKISKEESSAYFATRPRMSQIGAWASRQSDILPYKEFFEEELARVEKKFQENQAIPKPDFWGGYCCVPSRIEFWQGRDFRLHDRLLYTRKDSDSWETSFLFP